MPFKSMKVSQVLADGGPLANQWPGFQFRHKQLELSQQIETALNQTGSVALEAPTGTGKTLAYLLPAILSHRKVIISVGNLTLQDHLWWGEYQKLRTTLSGVRQLQVLKGCENYLCRRQLKASLEQKIPELLLIYREIQDWLLSQRDGDVSTLPVAQESRNTLVRHITVSADQCSGKNCPHYSECYFQKARSRASTADLLLINHTLLLSDKRLFEKGLGELLPEVDAIIVDEAHQLPDLLVRYNTDMIDGYRVQRWIKRMRRLSAGRFQNYLSLPTVVQNIERIWQQIQIQLNASDTEKTIFQISAKGLNPLLHLFEQAHQLLLQVHQSAEDMTQALEDVSRWVAFLQKALTDSIPLYCDVSQAELKLYIARVISPFANLDKRQHSWIFISATLAVDQSFDYFQRILCLPDLKRYVCGEAMDYPNRALLCVPNQLPAVTSPDFYPAWVNQLVAVADRVKGGILCLFSSHQALQICAELLHGRVQRNLLVYKGSAQRQQLLQQFRQDQDSILLATGSFWEGIDIQGASLRCVAIDKLPFASPDDLLSLAWQHMATEEGRNAFQDYAVPQAITRLRQGVGRLLRSSDDFGLVLLGDQRIFKKSYGQRFLQSIPSMPITDDLDEVTEFFTSMALASINNDSESF